MSREIFRKLLLNRLKLVRYYSLLSELSCFKRLELIQSVIISLLLR